MNWLKELTRWARFCPHCGRSFAYFDLYCNHCLKCLYKQWQPHSIGSINGWPVHYLFEYGDGGIVDDYINRQKLGNHMSLTSEVLQLLNIQQLKKPFVVVPAPGRHALKIAQWVAYQTDSFIWPCLYKRGAGSQKNKSRMMRNRIMIKSDFSQSKLDSVLFVDDVITTGSTMKSSYQALTGPRQFQAVCIALTPRRKAYNSFKHVQD